MPPEYSEYEDEALEVPLDDGTALTTPGLSDDAETHARKQARKFHLERQRSRETSFTEKPELKRLSSRTDLKRQLSKQVYILPVIQTTCLIPRPPVSCPEHDTETLTNISEDYKWELSPPTHTRIHTRIHTRTHTHTLTYTHSHTHTHTLHTGYNTSPRPPRLQ